ncbi:MAG: mechanosensitive ion channel family protein [Actinobacteria bacterium]|nr:mechanosensitive ion channel family protein [Actinomycetota bacterium]
MLFGYEIPWLDKALLILLVIVVALVARWLLVRAIGLATHGMVERARRRKAPKAAGRIIAAVTGADDERYQQRAATMGSLLRSVVAVGVFTITVLTILAIFEVPLGPLLATAGVGGVALGFGAQSLVRDFLSGMFMIMEDQYGVGDTIDTGQVIGTVEEVSLRVTRLRDSSGQVWYVRNGEILRVGNQTQGWSTAIADVPIGNDEDAAKALAILQSVADSIGADEEFADVLIESPTVVGVDAVTSAGTTLRITAKTAPNQQWGVKRALLQRSLEALGEAGYHGPVIPGIPAPPA